MTRWLVGRRLVDGARAWWPARPRPSREKGGGRSGMAARMERHGRLSVLYLAGTPYETGYQQGVLARELIHEYRRAALDYVAPQVPGPSWLARPLLFGYTAGYWPTVAPEFAQEMAGIAHGAGVHPVEVLVSTAIWEIYHRSGCSEFAASGPATANGALLHGYNYDLMDPDHALIQPYVAALFYRPERGIPFVTVNTVGSVGANAGMNEAGITVAWDNTYLKDESLVLGIRLPVAPFVLTLRRLLQYATSIDEAIGIITESLPRPLADIVIIGSARENRAVALETAGRTVALRQMEGDCVWSTNCFCSTELAPHDRRGSIRAVEGPARWRRFPRNSAYAELLARQREPMTPEGAAAVLRDPYPREREGYRHPIPGLRTTICRDITSWSLVMEPTSGRIWISDTVEPGCQGTFFAFDLPGWRRLPGDDVPATGYHLGLLAAERFLAGDQRGARAALAEAATLDGPSAPILLLRAVVEGLQGEEEAATAVLHGIIARWPETAPGTLARAWLGEASVDSNRKPKIPFPSAIRPVLSLRPAAEWKDRAVRGLA